MKNMWKVLLSALLLLLWISTTFAGKIWLEPSTGQFIAKCPFDVTIMVDTQWVESNTIWVSFYIDDSVFGLNELNTVWAIFPAYTSFVRGKAWHGEKKWMQTISIMGTTAQKNGFTGKGKYATLKILPLMWVKSMNFQFYAMPWFSADDSNINYASWNTVLDALTEVIWGSYTFVDWECPAYELPIPITEGEEVILKTSDKKFFFVHQMWFFSRLLKLFIDNISYIAIVTLLLIILFVAIKKKKNDKNNQ